QRAVSPYAWRVAAALALAAGAAAASAPDWPYAFMLGEAALAAALTAMSGLALTLLAARAPSLRDEEW
ncbi:MAG: hypothetical protein AB7L65_03410, partial [Hyphomonadaceae bacterium]